MAKHPSSTKQNRQEHAKKPNPTQSKDQLKQYTRHGWVDVQEWFNSERTLPPEKEDSSKA
jgi:hypothetical protein